MSWALLLFRFGAFGALLVILRHFGRTAGARRTAVLFVYLLVMSSLREWAYASAEKMGLQRPYVPVSSLGQVGPVNLVVVAGWIFTCLLSFAVARRIQLVNFPGTNVFLTLALTGLVALTMSIAVEVTGVRIPLWRWSDAASKSPWLPFDYPSDALDAWGGVAFMYMLVYCGVRYRLVTPSLALSVVVMAAFFVSWQMSSWYLPTIYFDADTYLFYLYAFLAAVIGFRAPGGRFFSDAALREASGAPAGTGARPGRGALVESPKAA